MKKTKVVNIIFLLPLLIACNMSIAKDDKMQNKTGTNQNSFAVLELFTSEGCSSCPPADAVLAKLSSEYKGNVYALGFHVDYWNRLGWTDSFSNEIYSRRQKNYAAQLHLNSVYTPQLIINGKTELIGSDEGKARSILAREFKDTANQTIQLNAKQNANNISVSYILEKPSDNILNIALVQLQAKTNVKNGENVGHTLSHINIVRDFKTVDINKSSEDSINFNIPKGFSAKGYSVVAYLQDKNNLTIKGVVETAIQ